MKIVRLANYVGPRSGGMRTALRELGAGYLAAGHEPVLIVPGRRPGDEQTPQGRVITRFGPIVPFTGGYRTLLGRRRLAALLTQLRPDRLEVSDRTTLRWTGRWAREHGVPAVMVSHESLTGLFSLPADVSGMSRWHSRLLSDLATRLADELNRRSARDYQRIVCTTRWAAAEFERICAPNLSRIPLGVDLELFSPERHSDTVRNCYVMPAQTMLVHCGRLSIEKKPHRSIAALAGLRAAGVDAVLVVAGDGPLRRRLERAARATAGHVRRLRQRPEEPRRAAGQRGRGDRPGAGGDLRPRRAGSAGVRHPGRGERGQRAARGDRHSRSRCPRRRLRVRGTHRARLASHGTAGGGPGPGGAIRLASLRGRVPRGPRSRLPGGVQA
jgi:glycosyltransferase involved in cell wall biosynthesis